MRRAIKYIFIAVFVCVVAVVIFLTFRGDRSEQGFMEKYIVSPLPASMVHVKTLRLNAPWFGKGDCAVAYEIAPQDLDAILQGSKLPVRAMPIPESQQNMMGAAFQQVWPDEADKLQYVLMGEAGAEGIPGSVIIVASPSHNHVLFFISE